MRNFEEESQQEVILKRCFDCIAETGIENASIRDFSAATDMKASSLYYWFKDKDDIVIRATQYALNKVMNALFDFAVEYQDDVSTLCRAFPDIVRKYKLQLRVVFQVTTSPVYGPEMRNYILKKSSLYDEYSEKIGKQLNIPYNIIRPVVDLFVSAIVDYVIWDDDEKISREMTYINEVVRANIN